MSNIFWTIHGSPDILYDCQYGCRTQRSCETQLFTFVHDLAKTMFNEQQIDIVVMDFSKAFYKVPQKWLIQLKCYSIKIPWPELLPSCPIRNDV